MWLRNIQETNIYSVLFSENWHTRVVNLIKYATRYVFYNRWYFPASPELYQYLFLDANATLN
jgi:hypothetical protein